mmetsp:Transcript_11059/g.25358  ORF Transcript_11059/g.25358 Transcript_11059/m.25358 type:complete len:231 (+) Transcript_11059:375-1067(+)
MAACEASASPKMSPRPLSTAAPVSSQLDSMPSTRHSRGSAGNCRQLRLEQGVAKACWLAGGGNKDGGCTSSSVLSSVTASLGSLGLDRKGPPSEAQRSIAACHLDPTAEKVTTRPSACGPKPSKVTSRRGGVSLLTSWSPKRSGHSTRATAAKMAWKSRRAAIFPSGKRKGSRWWTGHPGTSAAQPARNSCVTALGASSSTAAPLSLPAASTWGGASGVLSPLLYAKCNK